MLSIRTTVAPLLMLMAITIAGCEKSTEFEASPDPGNTPWTHTGFDNADDKFTFAVFSDLTGGERDDIFNVAIAQLNLLRPEFIIGVGDLIEGGTDDRTTLASEWDSFDERAANAVAPLFYVAGNHDITNMVMREVWEQRYGARYYHFVYKDVLFLVLDTEDNTAGRMQEIYEARARALERVQTEGWGIMGDTEYGSMPEQSSGRIGAAQSRYFQQVIADNPNVRWTFLFMHKAAWERPDEQDFAAVEAALANRPYTLFHGHVHAYRHVVRLGRDYIRLGTTGGVQFADRDLSIDHLTLVTVDGDDVDVANLRMSGVFDKTGAIPGNGELLCYSPADCAD